MTKCVMLGSMRVKQAALSYPFFEASMLEDGVFLFFAITKSASLRERVGIRINLNQHGTFLLDNNLWVLSVTLLIGIF